MGEAGTAARETFQELASETSELASKRAKQVLDEVKKEAEAQGLTPSAAKNMLKDIAEKVKTVAGSARKSVNGS
jgi:chorismate mutase